MEYWTSTSVSFLINWGHLLLVPIDWYYQYNSVLSVYDWYYAQVYWRGLAPLFSVTYYLFSTCTLCYWRGPAPMIRTSLVYDWFHTCSTILTTCLDYNPSRDRFGLDGFIDCSCTSGYCLGSGASATFLQRLLYDYHVASGSGAWCDKALSVPPRAALMLTRWTLYNSSTMPDPRGFLRFVLGIGLLTIISRTYSEIRGLFNLLPRYLI
jgi:hypothetical protein